MKFGTRGFSRALISKIALIFPYNRYVKVYSGFLGPLPLCPKVVEIEISSDLANSG